MPSSSPGKFLGKNFTARTGDGWAGSKAWKKGAGEEAALEVFQSRTLLLFSSPPATRIAWSRGAREQSEFRDAMQARENSVDLLWNPSKVCRMEHSGASAPPTDG